MNKQGKFIVVEGIDGSGKTTQVENLRKWLPQSGLMPPEANLVVTREPGGTRFGECIRALLIDENVHQRAELLLHAASRVQNVSEVIIPALAAGDWVLSDRFTASTVAYQGFGNNLSLDLINCLDHFTTQGLTIDFTLWLDADPSAALHRIALREGCPVENKEQKIQFLERVRNGYYSPLRNRDSCTFYAIPTTLKSPKEVFYCCKVALLERFEKSTPDKQLSL